MTLVEVVKIIGDMLTELDQLLSDSGLPSSSPQWQQLFAMRVHMDNLQRRLVTLSFKLDDARFAKLTDQISSANALLKQQIASRRSRLRLIRYSRWRLFELSNNLGF